jgi:hypothetical protein
LVAILKKSYRFYFGAKAATRPHSSTTWGFEKLTDTSAAITDKQAPFGYSHLHTARPFNNFA